MIPIFVYQRSTFSRRMIMKIWLILSMITVSMVNCIPPEDPIKCTGQLENTHCTIKNSYGMFPDRSICRAAQVVYPKTEAELISAVAKATMAKRKIKVATIHSHSVPKLVCPDGDEGLLISTKYLNRLVNVDGSAMTVTVESGMLLRELIVEATKAKMALPNSPYWWGLTVGGMMATGAHGSSLWGLGSQVHDYVVRLRIVTPAGPDEGYAKVRTLEVGNPGLDAAKVSLGVLGVISQVTLILQPLFKRSVTFVTKDDFDFGDQAVTFGRKHEFADFMWYPSQKQVVYRIDDRVSSNTPGNGLLDFIGFRPTPSAAVSTLRTTEETQELTGDINGKCVTGIASTTTLRTTAYGITNNGLVFTGYPVIGYQNRIQSSGSCLDGIQDLGATACPWDPQINGLFFHQSTFTIALSQVKDFIADVKKLMALVPKSLCGLDSYNGILARYVTASSAYLGKQEDGVDFDFTYYRSKDPLTPRLFEDIYEEIEQIGLFKYNALPHWGKNRVVGFERVINKYKNADKFLKIKQMYDPLGLFSSSWTDQILGLTKEGVSIVKQGCALDGLCICSQDVHCAPEKGYFCRPGQVYEEARVCTKVHV